MGYSNLTIVKLLDFSFVLIPISLFLIITRMRLWQWLVLAVAVGFFAFGVYWLSLEKRVADAEVKKLEAELLSAVAEEDALEGKVQYLSEPENLVKEIKAQFNYRRPDEKLIIVVSSSTGIE